ncbi:MAG: nicotinate-nucleotide diphosphorylase (carboxylating), partial [Nitrosopumilaceae archaeon]
MRFNIKNELLQFLAEDIGKKDVTSSLLPKKKTRAKIISKQNGIVAGVKFARDIFCYNGCTTRIVKKDG